MCKILTYSNTDDDFKRLVSFWQLLFYLLVKVASLTSSLIRLKLCVT